MITPESLLPYQKKFLYMKQEFQSWAPALQELSTFCNPTRGFFAGMIPNNGKKIDHRVLLDSHARRAVRTLASGMVSGLTSPSRPWFAIGVTDQALKENDEVREWCDLVENILFDIFSRSNIYGALHSVYEEIGTFGTASFMLLEDYEQVIRARSYTAGEYFVGCDAKGRVRKFGREFFMSVGQMVEEFGLENCSASVQAAYNQSQTEQWIKINMIVEPNSGRTPEMADAQNMAFKCIYWQDGEGSKILRQDGYEEFPVLAPRWDTTTTADAYGRGPGWDALGDVKMLQKEQRMKLEGLDKSNNPPIQQDSSVDGDANTMPGGVTRFNGLNGPNAGVRPAYQVQPDVNAMRESIMECKRAIDAAFYADLFLMFVNDTGGRMTATEVAERQSEKLQVLGPVLERLENELLSPLIERTFAIAQRMGLIPPAPDVMQGMELKIRYISILAQAQKMVGATAMSQVLGFVGNLSQLDPETADIIDTDETGRIYADNLATPAKMMRSKEKVAARRQARAQAAQQAQQAQIAVESAKAGRDLAGAARDLGETKVGQNSALDATLGALTGAQPNA